MDSTQLLASDRPTGRRAVGLPAAASNALASLAVIKSTVADMRSYGEKERGRAGTGGGREARPQRKGTLWSARCKKGRSVSRRDQVAWDVGVLALVPGNSTSVCIAG